MRIRDARPADAGECLSSPVAYLEAWFVLPGYRRQRNGHTLIRVPEEWGRSQGCIELASDTWPDNEVSTDAHRSAGFADAGTVICFRKELQER
jgi:aminoglycoside 6'-N-acetyltransferase I